MFGYIKADLSKLNTEQIEQYKGVYCTLCNSLKKHYGFTARYLLNYDITFLALIRLALSENEPSSYEKYCPYKCKKCTCISGDEDVFFYCCSVLVILAYEKILDDIRDEHFFKKLFSWLLSVFFKRKYNKAKGAFADLSEQISSNIALQQEFENRECSPDKAAQPTADSLGKIFSFNTDDKKLYNLGYFLGRWIYFLDAADDLESDRQKGSFNVFLNGNYNIEEILNLSIGEAVENYKNIDFNRYKPIIDNILFDGTFAVQNLVLKGEKNERLRSFRRRRRRIGSRNKQSV